MRNACDKRSCELISHFTELREQYAEDGLDLSLLRGAYSEHERAKAWLRRNRDNGSNSQKSHYEDMTSSAKDNANKYNRLKRIDNKIRKKSIEEAPARVFLILCDLFVDFESNPLKEEDFLQAIREENVLNHIKEIMDAHRTCAYFDKAILVLDSILFVSGGCFISKMFCIFIC